MPKMIQIRGVPDGVHRMLKSRAARERMKLSGYLERELVKDAELPTMSEWLGVPFDDSARSARRGPCAWPN